MTALSFPPVGANEPVPPVAASFAVLGAHFAALDVFLREQLSAFEPEIRDMADYCIDTSGKRIRPALVFFSGGAKVGLAPLKPLVKAAAVVELVHLATLVHDDIMDGAELRRGRATASRKYGPEAAVLLGDALFAHALHLAADYPDTQVCRAVSESTRKVCAGEIVQTLRRRGTNLTRADYDRVIDLKTAELFRVSCELGARLGAPGPDFAAAAAAFGRHLGIAYQIYDDLVDFFGREQHIGKTLGTDLASGKLTLPLLYLRDRLPPGERAALEAELAGQQTPQLARRLAQMAELRVFAAVAAEVDAELKRAESALAQAGEAHRETAAVLGALAPMLRAQVAALDPG
jgi:octaprenyl-diphosphate synthase